MPQFKISPNWDCIKQLEWLIENARFVFMHTGHKGRRPHIVLEKAVNGFDVIEIDYDRYGLTTNGNSMFSNWNPESLKDYSKEIPEFIKAFLISDGATDLIN